MRLRRRFLRRGGSEAWAVVRATVGLAGAICLLAGPVMEPTVT